MHVLIIVKLVQVIMNVKSVTLIIIYLIMYVIKLAQHNIITMTEVVKKSVQHVLQIVIHVQITHNVHYVVQVIYITMLV
jgi:hypothetical protein